MRRVISLLLENEAGALSRVAGLFSARGYNIESLTVAPTDDATLSHMTIVTYGSDLVIEQITKQLNKLIDVVRLIDLTEGAHIEREMLLAKVTLAKLPLSDLKVLVELFNGCIIDICQSHCTVEVTGTGERLDAFVEACGRTQIIELVRSGVSGITRGTRQSGELNRQT